MLTALAALWKLADADGSGGIDRLEYLELHSHLFFAMSGSASEKHSRRLLAEARRIAEAEWDFDSHGRRELDMFRFQLSLFQLVDALVARKDVGPVSSESDSDDVSLRAFARFVRFLVHHLCTYDSHEDVKFRWDLEPERWLQHLPPCKRDTPESRAQPMRE